MKRYYILFLLVPMVTLGASQNLEFISTEADVQLKVFEKQVQDRIITIIDGKLRVSNFFENSEKGDLIADIQHSEQKEYLGLGMSKWHYGRVPGDESRRTYALIVPVKKDGNRVVLQEILDNVLISNSDFYLD